MDLPPIFRWSFYYNLGLLPCVGSPACVLLQMACSVTNPNQVDFCKPACIVDERKLFFAKHVSDTMFSVYDLWFERLVRCTWSSACLPTIFLLLPACALKKISYQHLYIQCSLHKVCQWFCRVAFLFHCFLASLCWNAETLDMRLGFSDCALSMHTGVRQS